MYVCTYVHMNTHIMFHKGQVFPSFFQKVVDNPRGQSDLPNTLVFVCMYACMYAGMNTHIMFHEGQVFPSFFQKVVDDPGVRVIQCTHQA
jgi:hypothetical protein